LQAPALQAPQRPAPPTAAAAAAPPRPQQQQAKSAQVQAERRAQNAEYGAQCLIDRRVEMLKVWQVNAAGALVRNELLSGVWLGNNCS
jgi:hypothetical protein